MDHDQVSFRVLSPVEVRVGANAVRVAAPGQRAVLTLLLLNANRTVNASQLIEGVWRDARPQHPEPALHVVVCRLRRTLGVLAPRLIREACGYRIEVDCDELDLTRAQAFATEANAAMRDRDWARAAALFDSALACWTGEPLADVTMYPFYDAMIRTLREMRVGIVESRNAAYLRCGRHLDVLADIDGWVEAEPWRERLRAHQMVALYRSGRQIDALATYESLRRLLVADFGVEPHADLQRLHGRILRRDASLLVHRTDAPAPLPAPEGLELPQEITLDRAHVVMVEAGPGLERRWLVAELPQGARNEPADHSLRRVSLSDWLAEAR
jgi:DNA-binding SARP family transcriptional activator